MFGHTMNSYYCFLYCDTEKLIINVFSYHIHDIFTTLFMASCLRLLGQHELKQGSSARVFSVIAVIIGETNA